MSLLRLLTAGKSLVGLKDSGTRYRLSSPQALPKFDAKENPFRATITPEKAQTLLAEPKPSAPPELLEPSLEAEPTKAPTAQLSEPAEAGSGSEPKSARQSCPPARAGWTESLGKVKSLFARRSAASSGRVELRPLKSMVQGELSLDRVKVMRNDLSDSDLEVVARRKAPPAVAPAVERQSAAKAAEGGWGRVTGLFGAGKV